jgi:hypothetical protein
MSALGARLEDEMQVPVLQVSHAAVDEARRAARRATREIVFLDKCDVEAPERGFVCDATPGDSATDDKHIERSCAQRGETRGATRRSHHASKLQTPATVSFRACHHWARRAAA